jgi:DNA-binding XRE family transcriptional regulator
MEIERRVASGESLSALAREYGISRGAIRNEVSASVEKIKDVAEQIVKTEQALSALPISARVSAIDLSQKLMVISTNLATAAELNSGTAIKMAQAANIKMQAVDEVEPEKHADAISMAISLVKGSNDAARMPIELLAANQGAHSPSSDYQVRTLADFYNDQDVPKR